MHRRDSLKISIVSILTGLSLSACHYKSVSAPASAPPPDGRLSVLPPPAPDSYAQKQDDEIFMATRKWVGTPRWTLATNDDDYRIDHVLKNFSCAAGFTINTAKAPRLKKLIVDMLKLEIPTMSGLKRLYKRPRPFVGNDAPTCMINKAELGAYRSYPSGHTMLGTTVGMTLAALLPDRADRLDMRGRIFGESRVVCGAHWASDVQAGAQIAAQQTYLNLMRPEIKAQLPAVKEELEALRRSGEKPGEAVCQMETDANTHSPFRLP